MPVAVSTGGALSGKVMVAVAAGNAHNLALCADGTAVAWRDNTFGQLGNNSTTQYNAPVVVNTNGVLAGKMVVAVAAGFAHSLALCSDGTLAAWGDNSYGQLGTGNNPPSLVPVAVNRAGVLAGKTIIGIVDHEGLTYRIDCRTKQQFRMSQFFLLVFALGDVVIYADHP